MKEGFLDKKLSERASISALRSLRSGGTQSDFYSNDYLGIVKNGLIERILDETQYAVKPSGATDFAGTGYAHGSTGSRLLAGNYPLIEETEKQIAVFHEAQAALIFNSGYNANMGLMSCIANRGDQIYYDELCHASIRDGIRLSFADSFSFPHNDLEALERKLKNKKGNGFVVTESVFSMDGDQAPLEEMAELCERYDLNLIVDEAHATGIVGERGEGLVQALGLQNRCLARVHTFGKALGCHGAVILGSQKLRDFLINFCRPFIYSTSLPPVSVAAIRTTYSLFPHLHEERKIIRQLIPLFNTPGFTRSSTCIQCFILPGNERIKEMSRTLFSRQLDVRPIMYPTVPAGLERLRITLHSYNSLEEVQTLIAILSDGKTDTGNQEKRTI